MPPGNRKTRRTTNSTAATAMKKRGASRAATINGYGHRKNTKAVKDLLYKNRKRWKWNKTQVRAGRRARHLHLN